MAQLDWPYATEYANSLLERFGAAHLPHTPQQHPAWRWAQSGAMTLTGYPLDAAQMCPVPLAAYADGVVASLQGLRPGSAIMRIDGAGLLGERAALAGYGRAGAISAGGSCRLLQCEDGWLALNLARSSDWDLLPAWLEGADLEGWNAVAAALRMRAVEECLHRGRLLGLAVAAMRPRRLGAADWCRHSHQVAPGSCPAVQRMPLVVDLSALWAGPLCTNLLQLMGAQVIKVESIERPDGMRLAGDGFYDLLNAGKASVALALNQPHGRAQLRQLLDCADIVVEASRPRALRQMGIDAEQVLQDNPGLTWISITGHGRDAPGADWIAFGDDGAVAGGLSQVMWDASARVMFCGDAIGDPLTGLHAALAAWLSYQRGGGRLLSIALAEVVAYAVQFAGLPDEQARRARAAEWARAAAGQVGNPRARLAAAPAHQLGADTAEILAGAARRQRRSVPLR